MKWYNKMLALSMITLLSSSMLFAQSGKGLYQSDGVAIKKNQPVQSAAVSYDVALEPTHLMLVPTAQVLQRNQYVLSFHEFSFGIDNNIQIFICPWDPTPGRIWLGGKFGVRPDLAFGVGISDQYWYFDDNNYTYFHSPMFGLYGVKTIYDDAGTAAYGMADLQFGDVFNFELGAGLERAATRQVKLMGELALSSNYTDHYNHMGMGFDLNLGIRYMVASLPPLKIDFGINVKNYGLNAWPYIDVSYSSQIR
jgi:hypothetical protein